MIEMVEKKELIPENDLQELWQLSGRVQATVAWLKQLLPDELVNAGDVLEMLTK